MCGRLVGFIGFIRFNIGLERFIYWFSILRGVYVLKSGQLCFS